MIFEWEFDLNVSIFWLQDKEYWDVWIGYWDFSDFKQGMFLLCLLDFCDYEYDVILR